MELPANDGRTDLPHHPRQHSGSLPPSSHTGGTCSPTSIVRSLAVTHGEAVASPACDMSSRHLDSFGTLLCRRSSCPTSPFISFTLLPLAFYLLSHLFSSPLVSFFQLSSRKSAATCLPSEMTSELLPKAKPQSPRSDPYRPQDTKLSCTLKLAQTSTLMAE